MFVLARAITYATLFVGLLLVVLPARILSSSGIVRPTAIGPVQVAGLAVAAAGAALALSCVLAFSFAGRGTPAPFDPPRRLVISGPYRYVRTPMYVGAVLLLGGAACFFGSLALLGYAALFGVAAHGFVIVYEEPALTRRFGDEYRAYRGEVRRWWPRAPRARR
jgi:protein-S-isoprenylcysteine O-methyltransferase Ste14